MSAGPLRQKLDASVRANGWRLQDLTVLARQNDPFLQDTPAGHRNGQWFAEQIDRFVRQPIHLRGLHYRIVAVGDVRKPEGKPYTNTDEDWRWLQEHPAKAGRWLGQVSFGRIVDERNAQPEITVFERAHGKPFGHLSGGYCGIDIPSGDSVLPHVYCDPPAGSQPYRVVLIGEKTSLGPVLRGLRGIAELLLPTGEISDTLIHGMAARAVEDGRPATVLYFSDFDPAGHQMPISVSRKLQALKLLEFPSLLIEVHHVALTLEQVVALDLPSTPLKATERRADRWREVMGREQTEIDAFAALRPDVLQRIAGDAIAPFGMRRLSAALQKRGPSGRGKPTGRYATIQITSRHAMPSERLDDVEKAVGKLRDAQERAAHNLAVALPRVERVEPRISRKAPAPLFNSQDDFVVASRRLIDRKRLNGSTP